MQLRTLLALTGLLLGLVSSAAFAALSDFNGSWQNVNANTSGITRLQIAVGRTGLTIHAWGQCHPRDCDWGSVPGHAYAATVSQSLPASARAASAVFASNFSQTTLLLHPERGNRLRAEVYTRFTDRSGRSNYTFTEHFARRASAPTGGGAHEDCIAVDYRRARVAQINGRWKIAIGSMWLKDFGGNRREAEQALRVLRHYRMDKQCFVGRPKPSMEYYLSNNRAPAGALGGEDCLAFNPARIQVSHINGRWKIVEGSHWLMDFGTNRREARQAFTILRHYRFTRSCFVGRPRPSMTYFRR